MKSAIYAGTVRHRRFGDPAHEFSVGVFLMYLDLGELPGLFDGQWLWSARGPALAWFRRGDYLGPTNRPLDGAVRDEVERLTGRRPEGPVRMLTHLRYFGFVMNPVTFYYCFDSADRRVETILAEITNTPWRERHTYAIGPVRDPIGPRHRFAKAFHVSPFMGMDHEYVWRFSAPEESLVVHMDNEVGGERVFDATLTLRRREISGRALAGVLLRYPLMTARVAAGIYGQAARLRLKGAQFHPHPREKRA